MTEPFPPTYKAPHVGILGGGAMGLAAALRLAEGGCRVTVLEREGHLGGLAVGFEVGGNSLEKFYHHIFKTDTTIIRFIDEVGLSEKLQWKAPTTSLLWHGQMAKLNSVFDFLRFPFLPFIDRVRWVASLGFLKLVPNGPWLKGTAYDWMRRMTGPRVTEVFTDPLLRGKFGDRAEEIALTWWWSRFHERTFRLGYVKGGFQQFYDALGEHVRSFRSEVRTSVAASNISVVDGKPQVKTSTGETLQFDRLLVTLPTRLFTNLAPDLPAEWIQRYPGPDHFGAQVAVLALDRQLLDGVYWLNVNDRDMPFLALVEHTNYVPASEYGGNHLVYLGNYLPMDHRYFSQPDEQTLDELITPLTRLNPAFDRSWVKQTWLFKAPFAQPIVSHGYLDKLPPHRTPLPGVFLANMAHVYPQDRGQNYSLKLGEKMAETILDDLGISGS